MHVTGSREINVVQGPHSLSFRGYSISIVVRNTQTLVVMLFIRSASLDRANHGYLTSKRGHKLIGPKYKQRLGIGNSGLPKWGNSHGNGSVIVGKSPNQLVNTSKRLIHTEVRKSEDSLKLEARVGLKSLKEMLKFDENGKCINAFQVIKEVTVLEAAYDKLKSKPGNMVPGADDETLDGVGKS